MLEQTLDVYRNQRCRITTIGGHVVSAMLQRQTGFTIEDGLARVNWEDIRPVEVSEDGTVSISYKEIEEVDGNH